jgi:hypothetical protein
LKLILTIIGVVDGTTCGSQRSLSFSGGQDVGLENEAIVVVVVVF